MISLSVRVRHANHSGEYPVTPAVMVEFERKFSTSFAGAFSESPRMEQLFWLAWEASRANGEPVKPFDTWVRDLESAEPISDGDPGPLADEQAP